MSSWISRFYAQRTSLINETWNVMHIAAVLRLLLVFVVASLLKKILKSRLFVGRSRLSDSWMQENAMGPFERRWLNIFKEAAQ